MLESSYNSTVIPTVILFCILSSSLTTSNPDAIAIFAGGCFWCIEAAYESYEGVIDVRAGFSGGDMKNPVYKDVYTGKTDHYESIEVRYNPSIISYQTLLQIFWSNIDPTDPGGQFEDRGSHYLTVIFYSTQQQRQQAERSKKKLQQSGIYNQEIVTKVLPSKQFYPAEEYHQNYFNKNSIEYTTCRQPSPPPLKSAQTNSEQL